MNEKAKAIVALAQSCLGYPYVYAALGEYCQPAARKRRKRSDHPTIVSKCQVLRSKNKKDDCEGCKYQGKRMFDCRGFTYWVLLQNGIIISAVGATTQYNTTKDWIQRGPITEMPNVVCCVFKYNGNKMIHTGLHIGDGKIIHCSCDVETDTLANKTWTHYAIPKNLYTNEEILQASEVIIMRTLKRGERGDDVRELQNKLNELGYDCGTADSIFGTKTDAAVRRFQADNNLTIDGIVGPTTRKLLQKTEEKLPDEPSIDITPTPDIPIINPSEQPIAEQVVVTVAFLQEIRAQLEKIIKEIDAILPD